MAILWFVSRLVIGITVTWHGSWNCSYFSGFRLQRWDSRSTHLSQVLQNITSQRCLASTQQPHTDRTQQPHTDSNWRAPHSRIFCILRNFLWKPKHSALLKIRPQLLHFGAVVFVRVAKTTCSSATMVVFVVKQLVSHITLVIASVRFRHGSPTRPRCRDEFPRTVHISSHKVCFEEAFVAAAPLCPVLP